MSENNGAVSGYIYDGMTREAFIAAKDGMYPDVKFTYRPTLTQNRSTVAFEIAQSDPRKGEEIAAALVARQVVSWDINAKLAADSMNPEPVPIEVPHILRLHPALFNRMYRIVMCDDAGDVQPTGSVTTEESTGGDLERALAGAGPEGEEVKQAKN